MAKGDYHSEKTHCPHFERITVISNAACKAPGGSLSTMFQAGALTELTGDKQTEWRIYYAKYDIDELAPLD